MQIKDISSSFRFYFLIVLALVALRVLYYFIPLTAVLEVQAQSFAWPALILISLLGLTGTWLASKTGFPESWDAAISNRQRLLIPALIGLGLGVVALIIEYFQSLGQIDVPLPTSIPFYLYGGIVSEILMRLFLIPLPLWLFSLVSRGRGLTSAFWVIAAIVSLLEPLGVIGALYQLGQFANGIPPLVWVFVLFAYATNLLMAQQFRQSGFVAPIVLRLAFYVVWHILF